MATRAAKPTALTYSNGGKPPTPASTGVTGPFSAGAPINPSTRVPTTATVNGPYDQFRGQTAMINPGVPQSFVNAMVDQANNGARQVNPKDLVGTNQQAFAQLVNSQWATQTPSQKQQYQQQDAQAQLSNTSNAVLSASNAIPQANANAVNSFYNSYVSPALGQVQPATQAVNASDLQAESDVNGLTQNYTNTVNNNQAARMDYTNATNANVTDLSNQLRGAANNTNAANSAISSTWIPNAQQTNAANSALASNLWGATNSTNASNSALAQNLWGATNSTNSANSALGSQLTSLANSTNANQTAALNTLLGNVSSSNSQQNAALAQVQQQFSQLNSSDQAAYMKYLQETNPLMAQLVAQGSNPQDVADQRDVEQRYKDLSNPQVTAEERLIASQARQNFESQDKSSRDAVMAQLQGRGLQSGGLQIANMQGAGQQLAQDRMNAEMGLEANAQTRAMGALAGYGTESNNIRSADDAERNFQDVYAQNEALRVGNLAQQRNNQSLQTNQAITNRDQAGFNNATTSINNNFARDYTGYQANTQTNQDNFGRSNTAIQTNLGINQSNLGNTQYATNTNLGVNQSNLGNTQYATNTNLGVNDTNNSRLQNAGAATIGVNQTNLGNTGMAIGNQQATAGDNWNRYTGALSAGDTTAGNVLSAGTVAATMPAANRQRELNNAQGNANNALGGLSTTSNIQGQLSSDQIDALKRALGISSGNAATQIAGTGAGLN